MATALEKLLKTFPFCEIQQVTEDGQEMTFFPKTYCKVNSTSGAGRQIIFSDKKKDSSYKLMTAFYHKGVECENGILHSRYIASQGSDGKPESKSSATSIWGSIPYTDIKTKAELRGSAWGPLNIWDYHYRGLLMLLETLAKGYTSADVQTAIGGADGSMGITHFGITNIWGGTDKGFWIYGIDTYNGAIDGVTISNTNLHIVDRNGVRRDTGLARSGSTYGYPAEFETKAVTDQYDLNELLIGKNLNNGQPNASNGSCGDCQYLNGGCAFNTYWSSSNADCGPFYLDSSGPSGTNAALGFALRKTV